MLHLEAFAMLGALAWQAATVIKMFFCLGGRSHGGYLVLAPGSPPCVLLCLRLSSDPTTWHNVLPSRIDHGATEERPKLEQLQGECVVPK
jgi:hypothetical protein